MAYRAFEIDHVGALRRAVATDLPNLVVIAGPNGAGKSTLLHHLNTQRGLAEAGTRVTFLGPHRGWRKTTLAGSLLSEFQPGLTNYLEQAAFPGWRAVAPQSLRGVPTGRARDPKSTEEAFSFVKAAILKLDQRQQVILRDVWERQRGEVRPDDVPVLLTPLRVLVRSLLPHLEFAHIDSSNEADLRVLFRRVDGQDEALLDIDELSSGEKSVIGLMLPLVEAEIEARLDGSTVDPIPTFIIDEPEIHLHPSLQVLMIEHLSELAARGTLQTIVATQSPTIVDALDDESLFILAPVAAVPDGNQLVPIGRTHARLEAMRALTGSTHLLTRCRPIMYLEGEVPVAKPVSDQRLIELLIPEAKGWVLVSAGGRGTAVRAARALREAAAESLPGVPVFALVDRDQAMVADDEHVISWPVAMVENLLLDPVAIWNVLAPHREQLTFNGEAEVRMELLRIAGELQQDEVRLRVSGLSRPVSVRVHAKSAEDVDAALEQARTDFTAVIDGLAGDWETALLKQFEEARHAVEEIISAGQQLEMFRGKEILNVFFDLHVKPAVPGRKAFEYAVAREAVRQPRLHALVAEPVRRIERFVPRRVLELLEIAAASLDEGELREQTERLVREVGEARQQWEDDGQVTINFESVRAEVVRIAGLLPEAFPPGRELVAAAAQLGVRSASAPSP